MNIQGIFPTPLAYLTLSVNAQPLVEYAQQLEQLEPQGVRPGGWQSSTLDLNCVELVPLTSAIAQCLQNLAQYLWQFNTTRTLKLERGWINSNTSEHQLANNWSHLHSGAFMSLVYYAQVPEHSGELVFEPPHNFNDYCIPENNLAELNLWNAQRHHYHPRAGELIAFPSWIRHAAQPNRSGEQRISYAFNAEIAPV